MRNENLNNRKELKTKNPIKGLKRYIAAILTVVTIGTSTVGCKGNYNNTFQTLSPTPTESVNNDSDSKNISTPIPTPEVVTPTETPKKGDIDTDDNNSIETAVEKNYNNYEEFYESKGISEDQVRDLVFVLNDMYVDEDGNLIINEDRVHEAYSNIRDILYSDEMINMIGIIDEKENGIDIERDYTINEHPSLVKLVDVNKTGGAATASKLADYEEIRDAEIQKMNTEKKYDKEIIKEYVINNSISDVNVNVDHMDNITKNGQKFIVAATKFYGLQMAASMNSHTEYIEVNRDGVSSIKINPNEKERKMIADYNQYADEGIQIPESLSKDYIEYLNKKLDTGYFRVMCDEEAESVKDVNEIKSSLTGAKTYVHNN